MEPIGSISAVCGRVTAVDDRGRARVLRLDEPVCANETLIAALDAAANVRLFCGSELYVAPGIAVVLDADVFEHAGAADDGSLCLRDVQRVLRQMNPSARRSAA